MTIQGIDQYAYPGDERMAWLRANAGFRVTGFYLAPAPEHPDRSWMGRRDVLARQGWGFLPTYLGLQAGAPELNVASGRRDGEDASRLMAAAGFPAGSVVYLDIETGGPLATTFESYAGGWISAIEASKYAPGLYCSHGLLPWARDKAPAIWTFHVPAGAAGETFDPGSLPAAAVDPGAVATQYRQNVRLKGFGAVAIDLNVCRAADPSNLAAVSQELAIV